MRLRKATRRPSEMDGFSPVFAATWAAQYLDVLSDGGPVDRWGAERFNPIERVGLAAAIYAGAFAALRSERAGALLATGALWDRIDGAVDDFLASTLPSLPEEEIAGLAAFLIYLQFHIAKMAVKGAAKP